MASIAQIKTDNITKIYGQGQPDEFVAVSDASLTIYSGEITVLKGPSGSGKTTLLSLLGCMAKPSSGAILVNGKNVVKLTERFLAHFRRQTFGFIFQQFNLIRDISALENILLPLYPSNLGFRECRRQGMELLEKFSMQQKAATPVRKLSGGEQQRVAIARALINKPDIIIADEPTAHLDRSRSEDFLKILWQLNSEGKTVIIATHDPLVYECPEVTHVLEIENGMITGDVS